MVKNFSGRFNVAVAPVVADPSTLPFSDFREPWFLKAGEAVAATAVAPNSDPLAAGKDAPSSDDDAGANNGSEDNWRYGARSHGRCWSAFSFPRASKKGDILCALSRGKRGDTAGDQASVELPSEEAKAGDISTGTVLLRVAPDPVCVCGGGEIERGTVGSCGHNRGGTSVVCAGGRRNKKQRQKYGSEKTAVTVTRINTHNKYLKVVVLDSV